MSQHMDAKLTKGAFTHPFLKGSLPTSQTCQIKLRLIAQLLKPLEVSNTSYPSELIIWNTQKYMDATPGPSPPVSWARISGCKSNGKPGKKFATIPHNSTGLWVQFLHILSTQATESHSPFHLCPLSSLLSPSSSPGRVPSCPCSSDPRSTA